MIRLELAPSAALLTCHVNMKAVTILTEITMQKSRFYLLFCVFLDFIILELSHF